MQSRTVAFCLAVLAAAAASVQAQPTAIEHKGVACIVVAKYPKLKACFGAEVLEPRAYFHAEGVRDWFWVKMGKDAKDAPEPGCYAGILPKPSRKLLHKHIEYYLEVVDKGQRTREYDPLVVRQARECKKDAPVAPVSPTGPVAVFPAVPAGFALGGFPTAAVVGGTLAAAGVAGALVANNGTTTTTTSSTTPAAPVTTPTTLPSPGTPPAPFALSCQADPRSGPVPLTVTFTAFASGGTGSYDYDWRFGDGARGIGRRPVHTYTSTGTFGVLLIVTSGDLVRRCEKSITVNEPAPLPPLYVTKTGTGSGTVTDDKGKINCGPTCSASYVNGTLVSLSAAPSSGSTFIGWSGDCSGTGACVVRMDQARSVTAQFEPSSFILSVTKTGTGSGTVTDDKGKINCGPTCSGTYTNGTMVSLSAAPASGSGFIAWSGDCSGTGACVVTMDKARSVNAQFNTLPPVTLTFNSLDATTDSSCGTTSKVNINPPNTDCAATPAPGTTCSPTYTFGTVVTLTSISPPPSCARVCWSGACSGTPQVIGSVCTLTMNGNKIAGAAFRDFTVCGLSAEPPVILTWNLALDVPGAIGQAVVDGQVVVAESGRRAQQIARRGEGEAVVAANLVKADGKPGTWRFEAEQGEAIEPGSLRVIQGDVALLTPTAVVFRLKGNAGEQVSFSYRLRR